MYYLLVQFISGIQLVQVNLLQYFRQLDFIEFKTHIILSQSHKLHSFSLC